MSKKCKYWKRRFNIGVGCCGASVILLVYLIQLKNLPMVLYVVVVINLIGTMAYGSTRILDDIKEFKD